MNQTLVERLEGIRLKYPWEKEDIDIGRLIGIFLRDYGISDDLSLKGESPLDRNEINFLEYMAENIPKLEDAAMEATVIERYAKWTHEIVIDARNSLETDNPKLFYKEKQAVARAYIGWLTQDLIDLKKKGLDATALKTFMHYATRTCFTGRSEHDHLSEEKRLQNYERALRILKEQVVKESFQLDPSRIISGIFKAVVYGDRNSGIDEMWIIKIGPDGTSEEYKRLKDLRDIRDHKDDKKE